ncbi:chemotaxis protein MotB [Natronocella acetinitrilica]|uniref:Chemotaxis protein MotB n=1 Tax=Natronocella acetinitrilica TaxID=414046 RepID=A0AAE3G1L8_9GAMM|nr:OmpA family protein [Natronocella acetinitrilica]MCP1673349.1 chemotaxis protein MotB [Natronocella acetinitrilica]
MSDPLVEHANGGAFRGDLTQPVSSGGEGESWLLIYLDVLTLLLTLFVVLLAFTDFDAPEPSPDAMAFVTPQPWSEPLEQTDPEPEAEAAEAAAPPAEVDPLARFEIPELADGIEVQLEGGRLSFRIRDSLLFGSGSAQLTGAGGRLLDELVGTLLRLDGPISVEGHTDDRPIATARFPSNWELSSSRAIAVLRRLQLTGIDRERLRAVGYADTRPIADNADSSTRAANRRVELVLHMDLDPADPIPPR